MARLGLVRLELGDLVADTLLRAAAEMRERLLPPGHPEIAESRTALERLRAIGGSAGGGH